MELQELVSAAIMKGGDARVCEAELGKVPDSKSKLVKDGKKARSQEPKRHARRSRS
jgi:hypothetical protein